MAAWMCAHGGYDHGVFLSDMVRVYMDRVRGLCVETRH